MLILLCFPGGTHGRGLSWEATVCDICPLQPRCGASPGPEAGLPAPWHSWQEQSQGREELNSSSDPQPARLGSGHSSQPLSHLVERLWKREPEKQFLPLAAGECACHPC